MCDKNGNLLFYTDGGTIWNANHTIMQNIFFLVFLIFFNKWIKNNEFSKININIFCQLFFLALAVYTIQYYAVIYLYAMYIYFRIIMPSSMI